MLGLIISLQGLAVIAFFFGAFNASKGLKMFSEDYGAPQGYLMCIGGALTGLSAAMFMPIKPMGIILWIIGSICCFIGVSWYDNTHKDTISGQIIRIFTMVFVLVILYFSYNIPYHKKNGSSTAISFIIEWKTFLVLFTSFILIWRISYA